MQVVMTRAAGGNEAYVAELSRPLTMLLVGGGFDIWRLPAPTWPVSYLPGQGARKRDRNSTGSGS